MALRQQEDESSLTRRIILICVSVLTLGASGYLILKNTGMLVQGSEHPIKLWYYDLNTASPFPAQDHLPPIEAPSGPKDGAPAGVRAYYYACGQCPSDPAQLQLAWLETYEPEVIEAIKARTTDLSYNWAQTEGSIDVGHVLVMAPGSDKWVSASTDPEAAAKIRETSSLCPDMTQFHFCQPR